VRAEDFCSLDVFYEGLGISKLLFLIKIRFFLVVFFFNFCYNPGSDLVSLEMPDPDEPGSAVALNSFFKE
jgi:hypothetical protein